MRKILAFIFPLAFSLTITFYPIKNVVEVGDKAIFQVLITNNENKTYNINIYGPDISPTSFTVSPFATLEKKVEVTCKVGHSYRTPLYVRYNSHEKMFLLPIIGKPKRVVVPKCELRYVQDKNVVVLKPICNYRIKKFSIQMGTMVLFGKESLKLENLIAGDYPILMKVEFENYPFPFYSSYAIEVKEYKEVVKKVIKKDYFFFRYYIIEIDNRGNVPFVDSLEIKKKGFVIKGGKNVGEYAQIPVEVQAFSRKKYSFVVLDIGNTILTLLVVGLVLYAFYPPVIKVFKEYFYYSKEGKTYVHVNIKLKALKDLDDIRLIDEIPSFAKIEKYEVLEPKRQNSFLIWDIGKMEAGEELYLGYTITFSFEVLKGKIVLPKPTLIIGKRKFVGKIKIRVKK